MKKIVLSSGISIFFVLVFLLGTAGYFIGDYFVDFALKRGNASDPMAPPAACVNILDPNVQLPPKPQAVSEAWQLHSVDGLRLEATHFSPRHPSHQWVILVHGYGRSQQDTWDYAEAYLEHGYEVLTPDLRASGKSEGTYLTMGALESSDIQQWVEQIVAADPQAHIVLHGISMGAATVMLASARPMPVNLAAVIEDCGYTSAYAMFTMQLRNLFNLPAFPIMDTVDFMSRHKTGVAMSDAAPIRAVAETRVPMLFIHGDADKLVPYTMMQELYNASDAPVKEAMTVKGAAHAGAKAADANAYYQRVFDFADRYTK